MTSSDFSGLRGLFLDENCIDSAGVKHLSKGNWKMLQRLELSIFNLTYALINLEMKEYKAYLMQIGKLSSS